MVTIEHLIHQRALERTKKKARNDAVWAVIAAVVVTVLAMLVVMMYVTGNIEQELINTETRYENQLRTQQARYEEEIRMLELALTDKSDEITRLTKTLTSTQYELSATTKKLNSLEEPISLDFISEYWYVLQDVQGSELTIDLFKYVDDLCREWDVSPHLVWSIFEPESRFDPNAQNPSGASGLGQVMPSTGEAVWINILGHDYYDNSMLFDPYVNAEIVVTLLGRNLAINSLYDTMNLYSGGGGSYYYNHLVSVAEGNGYVLNESTCRYPD